QAIELGDLVSTGGWQARLEREPADSFLSFGIVHAEGRTRDDDLSPFPGQFVNRPPRGVVCQCLLEDEAVAGLEVAARRELDWAHRTLPAREQRLDARRH